MFQSLRPNSQIYILHKGDCPKLETGYVINQPLVRSKYQLPSAFGQPQEMVVDLSVKVGDQVVNYNNLPSQLEISDSYSNGETITISDNKIAMTAELVNNKQKKIDVINSIDKLKEEVTQYDKIIFELNPELAEKQEQKEEIDTLKSQMLEMSKSIASLMESNKVLIEKLSTTKN